MQSRQPGSQAPPVLAAVSPRVPPAVLAPHPGALELHCYGLLPFLVYGESLLVFELDYVFLTFSLCIYCCCVFGAQGLRGAGGEGGRGIVNNVISTIHCARSAII